LAGTAVASLIQNGSQHAKVLEIIKKHDSKQSGQDNNYLKEVIKEIENPTPQL